MKTEKFEEERGGFKASEKVQLDVNIRLRDGQELECCGEMLAKEAWAMQQMVKDRISLGMEGALALELDGDLHVISLADVAYFDMLLMPHDDDDEGDEGPDEVETD